MNIALQTNKNKNKISQNGKFLEKKTNLKTVINNVRKNRAKII